MPILLIRAEAARGRRHPGHGERNGTRDPLRGGADTLPAPHAGSVPRPGRLEPPQTADPTKGSRQMGRFARQINFELKDLPKAVSPLSGEANPTGAGASSWHRTREQNDATSVLVYLRSGLSGPRGATVAAGRGPECEATMRVGFNLMPNRMRRVAPGAGPRASAGAAVFAGAFGPLGSAEAKQGS